MAPTTNALLRGLLWAIEQQSPGNLQRACGDLQAHLEAGGTMPDLYLFHRLIGELLATAPDRLFRQEMGRRASELTRLPDDMLREAKEADRKRKRTIRPEYRKKRGVKPATD